jgi:hypothetical protein
MCGHFMINEPLGQISSDGESISDTSEGVIGSSTDMGN